MGAPYAATLQDSGQTSDQNLEPVYEGPFIASAAIAVGDACMLDITVTTFGVGVHVRPADSAVTAHGFAGVADKAFASGDKGVYLVRRGIVRLANHSGTAKDAMKISTTAGRLDTATVGTHHVVGYALATHSGNVGALYVGI